MKNLNKKILTDVSTFAPHLKPQTEGNTRRSIWLYTDTAIWTQLWGYYTSFGGNPTLYSNIARPHTLPYYFNQLD